MLQIRELKLEDELPLACSRKGTCCHGNKVQLNPWELSCLAREKKVTTREFRDLYCELGGIRLKFDGKIGLKNQAACSQYIPDFGCSVHEGRPLACRLFPLGRQRKGDQVQYIYEGSIFPCFNGCLEVEALPKLSVATYLVGQKVQNFETAQDVYLEVMQNLADVAFVFFLETSLIDSQEFETLSYWKEVTLKSPGELTYFVGSEWCDALMIPELGAEEPIVFAQEHDLQLRQKVESFFANVETDEDLYYASGLMMGVALLLANGLGVDTEVLGEHWIATAKEYSARS